MEIHRLLRKLQPLMPRQVERWSQLLMTAQGELKTLLERQIYSTARRNLGDPNGRLLLSLPPREKTRGPLHLGKIFYEKEKWDFGLTTQELMQNLAIFGRSGAGKTNVSFHLIEQLVEKRIGFLFLDWKRTARHLIPRLGKKLKIYTPGRSLAPFPFNPFLVPPGVDTGTYVNQLVDVMADAYTLGDGAVSVLQRAIHSCYDQGLSAPSLEQILHAIDSVANNERSAGWKISARRACESLQLSKTVSMDAKAQQKFAQALLQQSTIIELDGISQNTKKFLIPLLCYWIYLVQLAGENRERLQYVLFLEEAHHVLYRHQQRAKETLMNALLRQCRELGIGVVLIDQHPHLISSAGLGNCYTTICMNLKEPSDVNKTAAMSGMDEHDKRFLNLLPVGQGVVKLQDRWRQPFLLQFPLSDAQKGAVTDELLQGLQNGTISWSDFRERAGAKSRSKPRSREVATRLDAACYRLLHDIAQHPHDGVDARYKRLGISVDRGNGWKQHLIANGLVLVDRVKIGRIYRTLLRLTDEAKRLMTPLHGLDPQASFRHEYWKARVAKKLEKMGYLVELESERERGGGKMDISVARASERIAVEIETGKSDVVANVRRDLLNGVQRVVVVATDQRALQRVEGQLARAGLLLPARVLSMLPDEFELWIGGDDRKF